MHASSHAANLLSRRDALALAGASTATLLATSSSTAEEPAQASLGMVMYNSGLRRRLLQQRDPKDDLFEPLRFLQHCRSLGFGGMQLSLGVLSRDQVRALRAYAEEHRLFIDGITNPPRDEKDAARFEAEIRTASEVGVQAVRTVVMPGRRYEQFKSLKEFRDSEAQAERMLNTARPIVEKYKVRLAVENHKDQRLEERLALLKRLNSEFIGVCVDTGNNLALLEDPIEVVEALSPFAFTVHLKDQAVREVGDGFLLEEPALGRGCFDLRRMVEILRKAKPDLRFNLELITRDPLRVPCLAEGYWVTMPTMPASDLARTLRLVRRHAAKEMQQVQSLPLERQVQIEDANVAASLRYARETLGF